MLRSALSKRVNDIPDSFRTLTTNTHILPTALPNDPTTPNPTIQSIYDGGTGKRFFSTSSTGDKPSTPAGTAPPSSKSDSQSEGGLYNFYREALMFSPLHGWIFNNHSSPPPHYDVKTEIDRKTVDDVKIEDEHELDVSKIYNNRSVHKVGNVEEFVGILDSSSTSTTTQYYSKSTPTPITPNFGNNLFKDLKLRERAEENRWIRNKEAADRVRVNRRNKTSPQPKDGKGEDEDEEHAARIKREKKLYTDVVMSINSADEKKTQDAVAAMRNEYDEISLYDKLEAKALSDRVERFITHDRDRYVNTHPSDTRSSPSDISSGRFTRQSASDSSQEIDDSEYTTSPSPTPNLSLNVIVNTIKSQQPQHRQQRVFVALQQLDGDLHASGEERLSGDDVKRFVRMLNFDSLSSLEEGEPGGVIPRDVRDEKGNYYHENDNDDSPLNEEDEEDEEVVVIKGHAKFLDDPDADVDANANVNAKSDTPTSLTPFHEDSDRICRNHLKNGKSKYKTKTKTDDDSGSSGDTGSSGSNPSGTRSYSSYSSSSYSSATSKSPSHQQRDLPPPLTNPPYDPLAIDDSSPSYDNNYNSNDAGGMAYTQQQCKLTVQQIEGDFIEMIRHGSTGVDAQSDVNVNVNVSDGVGVGVKNGKNGKDSKDSKNVKGEHEHEYEHGDWGESFEWYEIEENLARDSAAKMNDLTKEKGSVEGGKIEKEREKGF